MTLISSMIAKTDNYESSLRQMENHGFEDDEVEDKPVLESLQDAGMPADFAKQLLYAVVIDNTHRNKDAVFMKPQEGSKWKAVRANDDTQGIDTEGESWPAPETLLDSALYSITGTPATKLGTTAMHEGVEAAKKDPVKASEPEMEEAPIEEDGQQEGIHMPCNDTTEDNRQIEGVTTQESMDVEAGRDVDMPEILEEDEPEIILLDDPEQPIPTDNSSGPDSDIEDLIFVKHLKPRKAVTTPRVVPADEPAEAEGVREWTREDIQAVTASMVKDLDYRFLGEYLNRPLDEVRRKVAELVLELMPPKRRKPKRAETGRGGYAGQQSRVGKRGGR